MADPERDLLRRQVAEDVAERAAWMSWARKAATLTLLVLIILALGHGAAELLPLLLGATP